MKNLLFSANAAVALAVFAISAQACAADKAADGNTKTKSGMAEVAKPFIQPPSTLTGLDVTEVPGVPMARVVKVQWDGQKNLKAHCRFDVNFGNGTVLKGESSYQLPGYSRGSVYATTGTFTVSVTPTDAVNDKCIKGAGASSKSVVIQ